MNGKSMPTLSKDMDDEFILPERFRSLSAENDLVYTCVICDYKIVTCNASFSKTFGIRPSEVGTANIRNFVAASHEKKLVSNLQNASESFRGTVEYKNKKGKIINLFTYLFHFTLAEKVYHGLLAYEVDKNEPPAWMPHLHSGDVQSAFADNVTEVIEVVSSNWSYQYVNDRACEYFGRSREELLTMSGLDTIYPDDLAYSMEMMKSVLSGERATFEMDIRSVYRDGTPMWTHFSGRGIMDDSNKTIGYMSIGWDIEERKTAEENLKMLKRQLEQMVTARTEALEDANRKLSAMNEDMDILFSNIPAGILVMGKDGTLVTSNDYLVNTHGKNMDRISNHLRQAIIDKSNPHLLKLFKDDSPFSNVEITIPMGGRGRDELFYMTGVPMRRDSFKQKNAVIVLTPGKEVIGLANRISRIDAPFHFENVIAGNSQMAHAIQIAKKAAKHDSNVLITGESGTGKEMIAQSIHNSGKRRNGPFVSINCGAIPRELIASELFGYHEGAFTGAKKGGKPGTFELADGGTLFLDEIGDMPLEQQVALLRVIQEKRVTKIGGAYPIPVDCRIICATNIDLTEKIKKNHFRRDLYYRINVLSIHIPPLRERKEDILLLIERFVNFFSDQLGQASPRIPDEIVRRLVSYDWPGNVRELQNTIERLFYLNEGETLSADDLPPDILNASGWQPAAAHEDDAQASSLTLEELRTEKRRMKNEGERQRIVELLTFYDWNVSRVAKEMGIARSTVYQKMRRYHMT